MHGVRDTAKKIKHGTHIAPGGCRCSNSIRRMMIFLGHLRDRRRLGRDINRLGIMFPVF